MKVVKAFLWCAHNTAADENPSSTLGSCLLLPSVEPLQETYAACLTFGSIVFSPETSDTCVN